jgi:hypothetical protein
MIVKTVTTLPLRIISKAITKLGLLGQWIDGRVIVWIRPVSGCIEGRTLQEDGSFKCAPFHVAVKRDELKCTGLFKSSARFTNTFSMIYSIFDCIAYLIRTKI